MEGPVHQRRPFRLSTRGVILPNLSPRMGKKVGRPVGEPNALALSRLAPGGDSGAVPTAMAIRAGNWRWPLQTDVGTSWNLPQSSYPSLSLAIAF